MTPQTVGVRIANMFQKSPALTTQPRVKNPRAKGVTSAVPVPPPATGRRTSPVPPPKAGDPQIRQEIQKILDLDKKIKSLQGNKSVQLQRIQEQARIHQRILGELESSRKNGAAGKPVDKDALLAQEKLRIIREQTQRNAQTVDEFQQKTGSSNVPEPAREDVPTAR
ncbi:MAG: hypothetical protein KTQ49_01435 [Candidatus Omnitrophica bacterium]|nr:hypothetical protein [Candidatus Omnitrophota bacterium]